MARIEDREKALKLRKQGKSYSQIKNALGISKSTLSNWLHEFPLSKEQIRLLRDINEVRIERFRETMRQKRVKRLEQVYREQKDKILPLSKRELLIAGLFLYWGEGTKAVNSTFAIANTDPEILKFAIFWLTKILGVKKEQIKIGLQLYRDMNVTKEMQFWSKVLDLSLLQFHKPYIKETSQKRINHKGSFGHGTCVVYYFNVKIKERVMMYIKAIIDNYTNLVRV